MKDIKNYNKIGQLHGYQKQYWGDNIMYRINAKNGIATGYCEFYRIKETRYHIR
jgi:hypothetical protein